MSTDTTAARATAKPQGGPTDALAVRTPPGKTFPLERSTVRDLAIANSNASVFTEAVCSDVPGPQGVMGQRPKVADGKDPQQLQHLAGAQVVLLIRSSDQTLDIFRREIADFVR